MSSHVEMRGVPSPRRSFRATARTVSPIILALMALLTMTLLVLVIAGVRSQRAATAERTVSEHERLAGQARAAANYVANRALEILDSVKAAVVTRYAADPERLACSGPLGCPGLSGEPIAAIAVYRQDAGRVLPPLAAESSMAAVLVPLEVHARAIEATREQLSEAGSAWGPANLVQGAMRPYCWRAEDTLEFCLLVRLDDLFTRIETGITHDAPTDGGTVVRFARSPGSPAGLDRQAEHALGPPFEHLRVIATSASSRSMRTMWIDYAIVAAILAAAATRFTAAVYVAHRRSVRDMDNRLLSVAAVSHSLRTPLTNLKLYAELIGRRIDDTVTIRRYLDIMDTEATRLTAVVDNVLEIGRGTASAPLSWREAEPDTAIRCIAETFSNDDNPQRPGLDLELELSASEKAAFDVDGLQQVLCNLLDNAANYAPGRVSVASTRDRDSLIVSVRDHGPGIPATEWKAMLEAWHRGHGAGTSGHGLGLAAAVLIARRNGGGFTLEAARPGCRFVLTLPVSARSDPARQ